MLLDAMCGMDLARGLRHHVLLVTMALGSQWACCAQLGPVVVHGDMRRDDLIRELGEPHFRGTSTVADLLDRELIHDAGLVERVRGLDRSFRVELIKWQSSCWNGEGDYFVALVDPETGRILHLSGQPMTAGRTRY